LPSAGAQANTPHEREPARTAGFTVAHQVHVVHVAEFGKRSANAVSGGVKGKIANIETSIHSASQLGP
ncbi:MAG TPA: hypothetical protein PLF40_28795, partial [Kofleriaceae bacterium]|nr:hypothetical protein [Kofleriaceae bacterium]